MEEKKLTDEEIIKAFEHCAYKARDCGCTDCSYSYFVKDDIRCNMKQMRIDTLDLIKRLQAEIERLTEEIKSIKEMTAEQVVESEKLKQSCAEAVNSFVRLETLYKIKCKELEIANKKLEEVKGGKTD